MKLNKFTRNFLLALVGLQFVSYASSASSNPLLPDEEDYPENLLQKTPRFATATPGIPVTTPSTLATPTPGASDEGSDSSRYVVLGMNITDGQYKAVVQDGRITLVPIPGTGGPASKPNQQVPLQQETDELTRQHLQIMKSMQTVALRRRTQYHLVALKHLLPQLEEIQRNMTLLVNSSDPSKLENYLETDEKYQQEMVHVENKLVKNRQAIERHTFESLVKVSADAANTMTRLFENQREILLLPLEPASPVTPAPAFQIQGLSTTTPAGPSMSIESIKTFIDLQLQSPRSPQTEDAIMNSMQGLRPEVAAEAFDYLLNKISQNRPKEDKLIVRVVAELQKNPSIYQRTSQIPEMVKKIFTPEKKCIQMRLYSRALNVETSGSKMVPQTESVTSGCTGKYWKFHLMADGKHFLISYESKELILGVGNSPGSSTEKTVVTATYDRSMSTNPSFLWSINLVYDQGAFYLQFVNKRTEFLLDANEHGSVYPHLYNGGTNQHWSIHN